MQWGGGGGGWPLHYVLFSLGGFGFDLACLADPDWLDSRLFRMCWVALQKAGNTAQKDALLAWPVPLARLPSLRPRLAPPHPHTLLLLCLCLQPDPIQPALP